MAADSKQQILDWYERQPRAVTEEFIESVAWDEIRRHRFDPRFIPVLQYMRDVEALTDMYYKEMRRTPTGRDPVISKFMERWGAEELVHGDLLNRFINELGVPTDGWQLDLRRSVTKSYRCYAYLVTSLANLIGPNFTATHMTFGAIHEMTTAQGYRRVIDLAKHPVLTSILKTIIREEAAHTQFYWRMARLELSRSTAAKRLARQAVERFWFPVGQGSKPKSQTDYVISTLFGPRDGVAIFDKKVTRRVQTLPGFAGLDRTSRKIENICRQNQLTAQT